MKLLLGMSTSRRVKMFMAMSVIVTVLCSFTGCNIKVDNDGASNTDGKTEQKKSNETQKDDEEDGKGEELVETVPDAVGFSDNYSNISGVFMFRGNNLRSAPFYGEVSIKKGVLKKAWTNILSASGSIWGGGAGWTGQPAIVQWPEETRKAMDIKEKFKKMDGFTEVIQCSLNGKIYFFDLDSGEATRDPIDLGNPIKGSVSVDPRGYPLIYVGQGIAETSKVGYYLINLINQKPLYFNDSYDEAAPRHWPGMDSSALFDKDSDTMFVGAENGLVYKLKLNSKFNPDKKKLTINPEKTVYNTYKPGSKFSSSMELTGIENSLAAYDNLLFFADNGGVIRCITTDFEEKWVYRNLDDTDATCVVEVENGIPMVYTGCEIDKQGYSGKCRFVKINGRTGKVIWKRQFKCYNRDGESPSNGGLLGTPVVGKNEISDRIIFTLCRYPDFDSGTMFALNKETGKTIWETKMATYCWPSAVDIYDSESGKAYIMQNDHNGTTWLFDGATGKSVFSKKIDSYLEASPAVFGDSIVFASRTGYLYKFKIK